MKIWGWGRFKKRLTARIESRFNIHYEYSKSEYEVKLLLDDPVLEYQKEFSLVSDALQKVYADMKYPWDIDWAHDRQDKMFQDLSDGLFEETGKRIEFGAGLGNYRVEL